MKRNYQQQIITIKTSPDDVDPSSKRYLSDRQKFRMVAKQNHLTLWDGFIGWKSLVFDFLSLQPFGWGSSRWGKSLGRKNNISVLFFFRPSAADIPQKLTSLPRLFIICPKGYNHKKKQNKAKQKQTSSNRPLQVVGEKRTKCGSKIKFHHTISQGQSTDTCPINHRSYTLERCRIAAQWCAFKPLANCSSFLPLCQYTTRIVDIVNIDWDRAVDQFQPPSAKNPDK